MNRKESTPGVLTLTQKRESSTQLRQEQITCPGSRGDKEILMGQILEEMTFELGVEEWSRKSGMALQVVGTEAKAQRKAETQNYLGCDKLPGIIKAWGEWQKRQVEDLTKSQI